MRLSKRLTGALLMGVTIVVQTSITSAQLKVSSPQIAFNSFTGVYYLSRDSHNLSLLTTEETILADFPSQGSFYGIKRVIPKNYQNHKVNVKVLSVSDVAGNPMPYKTASDGNNNLELTTGDPNITLYGSQTIKIRYQTSGVINLGQKTDEFLLNVNGRGWDQPIGKVNATLYLPTSFKASLKGDPTCYTALNTTKNNNCQINSQKSSQNTVITAKTQSLAAHQALVMKLDFVPLTFTNSYRFLGKNLWVPMILAVLATTAVLYLFIRKRK